MSRVRVWCFDCDCVFRASVCARICVVCVGLPCVCVFVIMVVVVVVSLSDCVSSNRGIAVVVFDVVVLGCGHSECVL